ncbi:phage tail assembly chaperone G [Thermoanaerobacterium thermosulfurigenes]|uniref:phage tail assembly chaperone G n=1 Tax=Thermoanaerobacterium thermosulfurigenes TaxID=33950 RepID=UPI003EF664B3
MELKLGDRTYVMQNVKARSLRNAIQLTEEIDFNAMKVDDLDKLVNFIVELFNNQFTIDDVYDNLDANELVPTLTACMNSLTGTLNAKLDKMPKKK